MESALYLVRWALRYLCNTCFMLFCCCSSAGSSTCLQIMLQEKLEFSCEGKGVYLVVTLEQVSTRDQEMLEGHKVSLCLIPGNTEVYSEFPSPDQSHVLI